MDDKNVVSIEDRIPKLKQSRRKKANRRLIFYLSIFFILIATIIYLQSPLSYVKNVKIKGESLLSKEDIIEHSQLSAKTNIWTIDREKVAEDIENIPVVESAEVFRKFPWTIEVHLSEYNHIGFIHKDGQFFPVLENGSVVSHAYDDIKGKAPLLKNFSKESYLHRMSEQLNDLPKSIFNLISEIHWNPTEENQNKILLYMNDGFIVDASIRNFSNQMKAYPSIVAQLDDQNRGIIHLGVGAYFETFEN